MGGETAKGKADADKKGGEAERNSGPETVKEPPHGHGCKGIDEHEKGKGKGGVSSAPAEFIHHGLKKNAIGEEYPIGRQDEK